MNVTIWTLMIENRDGERDFDESAEIDRCNLDIPSPTETLIAQALAYEAAAFDNDEDVNAADLVQWFADWRNQVKAALNT